MKELRKKLKKVLKYNKKTGIFTWKKSINSRAIKGSIAGSYTQQGYIRIIYDRQEYLAHRLAFLFKRGYFPEEYVDHIDRNKSNNGWKNLREASNQCNQRNVGNNINTYLVKGVFRVHYPHSKSVWRAAIMLNGKRCYIGSSHCFTEAVAMRLAAEQNLNWAGCDSSSPAYNCIKRYKQLGWVHKEPVL